MSCYDCHLSFVIETEPQPRQATSSVDPSVSRDATDIENPVEGNG